jgi:hypothetical protein
MRKNGLIVVGRKLLEVIFIFWGFGSLSKVGIFLGFGIGGDLPFSV